MSLFVILMTSSAAQAQPKLVILLRHAEEPESTSVHLSHRGFKRADLLTAFFKKYLTNIELADIYAQGVKEHGSSKRSIETLVPIAKELHLKIEDRYEKGDGIKLASDLIKDTSLKGKAVIIVWGSDEIGPIARKLGVKFISAGLNWDKAIFDRAWFIQLDDEGRATHFSDVAQHLLKDDSDSSTNSTIVLPPCDETYSNTNL